jgi:hypothetical protein
MFTVTHFRSEFIRQSQATILRKVTMTQFMLVVIFLAVGLGLLKAPFWLAPLFMAAGYVAGYVHRGEILFKRLAAYAIVWGRNLAGRRAWLTSRPNGRGFAWAPRGNSWAAAL